MLHARATSPAHRNVITIKPFDMEYTIDEEDDLIQVGAFWK